MMQPSEPTKQHFTTRQPGRLEFDYCAGTILSGKYRILNKVGAGGMGTVYRVQQLYSNDFFALKTLDKSKISDVSLKRFQREAKATASLNHINLVRVHEYGVLDDEQPYLLMDYVTGQTLAARLKQSGPIDYKLAISILLQACAGLAEAHKNQIVHRDVKPGNIILLDAGEGFTEPLVKVVDFGIAKLLAEDDLGTQTLTQAGEIFGSPLYMSPEQCAGYAADKRSDVYSLGCVLHEVLTGNPPHFGLTAVATMVLHRTEQPLSLKDASMGKTFPPLLEKIARKAMAKSPGDRYQTFYSFADDLRLVLATPTNP